MFLLSHVSPEKPKGQSHVNPGNLLVSVQTPLFRHGSCVWHMETVSQSSPTLPSGQSHYWSGLKSESRIFQLGSYLIWSNLVDCTVSFATCTEVRVANIFDVTCVTREANVAITCKPRKVANVRASSIVRTRILCLTYRNRFTIEPDFTVRTSAL